MSTKIYNNINYELNSIIDEIQKDMEFNFSKNILDYVNKLFLKSINNSIYMPEKIDNGPVELLEIAEFNLLKATIHIENVKEKNIYRHIAYDTYLKIFEKYEDELSFEICSNFENIQTTLEGTRFYRIRDNIIELLNVKQKNIPYIKRRLLILRYLEPKKIDMIL